MELEQNEFMQIFQLRHLGQMVLRTIYTKISSACV